MLNPLRPAAATMLVFAAFALAGCGDSGGPLTSDDGVLRYVPADTPYLLATPGDLPDELTDKLEPQVDATLAYYFRTLELLVGEPGTDRVAGLRGYFSVEGLGEAGIDRDSDIAIYGVGALPIMRISSSSPESLKAMLDEAEAALAIPFSEATIDGSAYRFLEEGGLRIVLAVQDNYLVAAAMPADPDEATLRKVLGIDLPGESVAASGKLRDIADRYGYEDFAIAFLDFERLFEMFIEDPSALNAGLLSQSGIDRSSISDECRAEYRMLAALVPRMTGGYTELSASRMASSGTVEVRADIAAALASLPASVPGLGADPGGIVSFGVGIDLPALREFYSMRLDALEQQPFRCEALAGINDGIGEGRELLNQPIPPIVYGIRGFVAAIDDVGGPFLGAAMPSDAKMRFLLATDNADGLLAMAVMFSPELAALDIEPDGRATRLDLPAAAVVGQPVFLAITENAIGLSLGDGTADGLEAMMSAAGANPAPLMAMNMDSDRYYAELGDALQEQQAFATPELEAAFNNLAAATRSLMDKVSVRIELTEAGVEFHTAVTLAD